MNFTDIKFGKVHCQVQGYQGENVKLNGQQYKASTDRAAALAGLTLYHWQSPFIVALSAVRVKHLQFS